MSLPPIDINAVFGFFLSGVIYVPIIWKISSAMNKVLSTVKSTNEKIDLHVSVIHRRVDGHDGRIIFLEQQRMEKGR